MTDPIDRRAVFAGVLAMAGAMAAPSAAFALTRPEAYAVRRAQAYLQGITTARGRFVQTDARGKVSKGDLYIQRPGKARFAYDAPSGLVVVSDGRNVTVTDKRLKTRNSYPLASTPLALFLARDIRLDRGVEIARFESFAGGFGVTAKDATGKTRGWITLTFAENPMRLTEWTVSDPRGQRTRVQIQNLAPASSVDPSLFVATAG